MQEIHSIYQTYQVKHSNVTQCQNQGSPCNLYSAPLDTCIMLQALRHMIAQHFLQDPHLTGSMGQREQEISWASVVRQVSA